MLRAIHQRRARKVQVSNSIPAEKSFLIDVWKGRELG